MPMEALWITDAQLGQSEKKAQEVIIPLSGHKRDQGLDLWQQAGQALGVTGYANGGTAGGVPGKQSPPGIGQAKGGIRVSIGNINISLKSSGGGVKSTNLLSALKEQKEKFLMSYVIFLRMRWKVLIRIFRQCLNTIKIKEKIRYNYFNR